MNTTKNKCLVLTARMEAYGLGGMGSGSPLKVGKRLFLGKQMTEVSRAFLSLLI